MKCSGFYSGICSLLTGIVFSLLTTTASAQDEIRAPVWVPNPQTVPAHWRPGLPGFFCWGSYSSAGELRGDFCFPLGTADYSCGTAISISRGESFTIGGGVEIEGIGINISETFTAGEAFTHTSGRCETCSLEVCYRNATIRHFRGTLFCANLNPFGEPYEVHTSYTVFTPSGRPFVRPRCRQTPVLCGCQNQPPPVNPPVDPPTPVAEPPLIEPGIILEGPDGGGAGVNPGRGNQPPLLIIDLGSSFNVSIAGSPVGEDHPFHNPGYLDLFTPTQLVWLQYFIENGIPSDLDRIAIRDIDGTTHLVDLYEAPLTSEFLDDCDEDQIPDLLTIDLGIVEDLDGNGTPDGCVPPPGNTAFFLRGDPNGDLTIDISDSMGIFAWLFTGGTEPPCLEAADANSSRDVDLSDGVYILQWLFASGSDPLAPFPDCTRAQAPIGCDRPSCP